MTPVRRRTRHTQHAQHTWIAALAFAAWAAVIGYRIDTKLMVSAEQSAEHWTMCDFQETLYYPAVAWLHGVNPYDPAFPDRYPVERRLPAYAPMGVLLHLPLALLPVKPAEAAYFFVTLALVLALAALTLRACGLPHDTAWVMALGTLMLIARPGHKSMLLGQSTMELALGVYLALIYSRDRPLLAAIGVALSTLKPQFGLPLLPLLLVTGAYRAVFGGLGLAIGLSLLVLARFGVAGPVSWWRSLLHTAAVVSRPSGMWFLRIDLSYAVRVLVGPHGSVVDLALALGTVAVAAFVVHRTCRQGPIVASALASTATCAAILLSNYHLTYDAIILTLPIVALLSGVGVAGVPRTIRIGLATLLLLPAVHYDLPMIQIFDALGLGAPWHMADAVANTMALTAALLGSALVAARARPPVSGR
ncbi:MAG TPA: glycosyltransferase family 87 protein [Candidatus Binatia bacterium]